MKNRVCYIMVRDVDLQDEVDGVGIEWGVDMGLDEGETLPEDVEKLTEAQYTVFRFTRALQGMFNEVNKEELEKQSKDAPSGIIVPSDNIT